MAALNNAGLGKFSNGVNKKILSVLLRAFISLFLIVILLYIMRGKYPQILNALKGARLSHFAMALMAFFIAVVLASYRLKIIINAQEIRVTFLEAVSLTFIGYFFNNFLPTAIGGDVVKAYYLSKRTATRTGPFMAIFVDRAIGLFTMMFMATIALILAQGRIIDDAVRYIIYAITAASLLAIAFLTNKQFAKKFFILLFFLKPIKEKLKKAYNTVHSYKQHKPLIFQSLAISVFSQLLFFSSIGILAYSIGSRISAMEILMRMPIVSAMSLLPSINGLGLREGSTVLLFGPLIGGENAFCVSILWLAVLSVISILGGAIYGLSPQFKVRLKEVE